MRKGERYRALMLDKYPAPRPAFTVSYHGADDVTIEVDFVYGANARALFENLRTVPTVADAQFFADGQLVEDWKR